MDNIIIPLKNKNGTPKLDEMGNPLQVKAPNPFTLRGHYFLTQETDEDYQD